MNRFFLLCMFFLAANSAGWSQMPEDRSLLLWYDHPATDWMTQALPIGNGYIGAMFYGGTKEEILQFSEGSLWSGGPGTGDRYENGNRRDAWKYLAQIREWLKEGRMEEADRLASRELTGLIHPVEGGASFGDYGAQQTMGELRIQTRQEDPVSEYKRWLDIRRAEGGVSYRSGSTDFTRTYFGSYPDKVMVYRFGSSAPSEYAIFYKTPHRKIRVGMAEGEYIFHGAVRDNGMEYEMRLKIKTDGKIRYEKDTIYVTGAEDMTLYQTASTEYTMDFPEYSGHDFRKENERVMAAVSGRSYEEGRRRHQEDYGSLFDRVSLNLGTSAREELSTDLRLKKFAESGGDAGLQSLYFQYGRYLMISASRPGTMPLHLQGKWNDSTDPPWACDYHMNINEQMLYWPAEVTNLSECHEPLMDYTESLVVPGRISAREFFNTRGWIVNTMNNAWGYTAPGWGFPWGFYPAGAAWLCRHIWEHYQFTGDVNFLRERGYPVMKEAALFWMDYLTEDEAGYLVSDPSYSPEHGGISGGASMDHQIARDVLNNCVQAADILGTDPELRDSFRLTRDRILPPAVGRWGQLMEWKEDVDDPESKHRHVSHLYALHPGEQITTSGTPALAAAARTSLNARGDDGTGWSLAWKVNFWARLKDGDRAYELYRRLLRPTFTQDTDMTAGGGSYPNLLCAHPPFQLDGNMGGTAGVSEMLLQSHEGFLDLLPALPAEWSAGEVSGLKARGNFVTDIRWENHEIRSAKIVAVDGGVLTVKTGQKMKMRTIADAESDKKNPVSEHHEASETGSFFRYEIKTRPGQVIELYR